MSAILHKLSSSSGGTPSVPSDSNNSGGNGSDCNAPTTTYTSVLYTSTQRTTTGASISGALENDDSTSGGFSSWAPIVIGLLAANLVVLLLLSGFLILGYVRKSNGQLTKSASPLYVPVKTKDMDVSASGESYRDNERRYD